MNARLEFDIHCFYCFCYFVKLIDLYQLNIVRSQIGRVVMERLATNIPVQVNSIDPIDLSWFN